MAWELRSADGEVVSSGDSEPRGVDPSADLHVDTIDMGGDVGDGDGFTLVADEEESYPFAVSASVYGGLRVDALGIYYSQRSGIEITPIEVDGETYKEEYARPAGHVAAYGSDEVNQGDLAVPCLPIERTDGQYGGIDHYGEPGWDCPDGYTLDVAGGWYDAGDHGKYVVNSGIPAYQLLSTWERNQAAEVADRDALGDATLLVPERDNGVPDVRWNLEWMLARQVPAGTEMGIEGEVVDAGGLVHHKLHDVAWTGLDLFPHEDPERRYIHRPSTAATLNLAAAAAHGVRLYDEFDPDFAAELLAAARTAWTAAEAHPELYAPHTNDLDPNPGGGPYDDTDVTDERYWAASQLYLTTGEDAFGEAVLDSPHHTGDIWEPTGFDWASTAAAGRLDLATVDSDLPDRDRVVASVLDAADDYFAVQASQPFRHPYGPDAYDWGSTHQVIESAVVIATAYDLSGEDRYLRGALEGIDYVLGRNASTTPT